MGRWAVIMGAMTPFNRRSDVLGEEPGTAAAGLLAGSVAAIAAVALSIPLESPSDAYFNSVSVAVASLGLGLGAGVLWRLLVLGGENRLLFFNVVMAALFVVVVAAALAMDTYLDRSVSFIVPVASLSLGVTWLLTVVLVRMGRALPWRVAFLTAAIALALGFALAGQGDQRDGRLELPPRNSMIVQGMGAGVL